jgi:hypothetical protein
MCIHNSSAYMLYLFQEMLLHKETLNSVRNFRKTGITLSNVICHIDQTRPTRRPI